MNFDIVIIGGGPAGTSAAISLARIGVSVALLEHATYPFDKTCAGILTEKTNQLAKTELSINFESFYTSSKVALSFNGDPKCCFSTRYPFTLVDRKQFNHLLLSKCKEAGVHLFEGIKIIMLDPENRKVTLHDSRTISYRVLIAADGVHSYVRKSLGMSNIKLGFCLQNTIERSKCTAPLNKLDKIYLEFGSIPSGYCWIVPNKTHIIVGLGMFTNKFDYPAMLLKQQELCTQIGLPNYSIHRGAHIPVGELVNQLEHPYENIIFIGDAAGLINPITGEGIYLAMLSGIFACEAYKKDSSQFRTIYLSMLQQVNENILDQACLLPQFYDAALLKNIIYQFKDCPQYLATICDETVSLETYDYRSTLEEIKQLIR